MRHYTSFDTGDQAGFVLPVIATLEGVPADAPVATLQLRVWDNKGGLVTRWEDTGAFGPDVTRGWSVPFEVTAIGGGVNPPPILAGLTSFNLEFSTVPEPGTTTLIGLGAVGLCLWRSGRRKQRTD